MTFSYMKLGTFFKDKHSETCIRTTSIIQKKKKRKKKQDKKKKKPEKMKNNLQHTQG